MNILVLGNGFYLAHGLPTTYKDFLDFADAFIKYRDERRTLGVEVPVEENEKKFIPYLIELFKRKSTDAEAQKIISEIEECIEDNMWIAHFKTVKIAQGWIDFESEISNIVQEFESIRLEMLANIKNDQEVTYLKPYQIDKLTCCAS